MSQQTPPEADATPDEAFELGEVHGYNKGYADGIASVQPPTREQIAEALYRFSGDWQLYRIPWRKQAHEGVRKALLDRADAVLALFPQPTPSAEPFPAECGKVMPHNPHNWSTETTLVPWEPRICSGAGTEQGRRMREHALSEQMYQHMMENTHPAEPVSIADMAAGTKFTAANPAGFGRAVFEVLPDGRARHTATHWHWDPASFIPSTIRNVTPPPATPEDDDRG